MEKDIVATSQKFALHAQEIMSLALYLCEKRLSDSTCQKKLSTELKALAAAAISLETALNTFMEVNKLCD